MVWGLLVSVTLTAQPTVSSDVLEPSVRNEVRHALARASSVVAATNVLSRAAADFARLYETNGLSATDAAIRLVSTQRADGCWRAGTNDVTAAAVRILTELAGEAVDDEP